MQVKFTKISYFHIGCNLIEVWFTQDSRFIQGSVSTGVTTSELSFSLLYIVGCLFFVIYCWLSFLCYILLVVFAGIIWVSTKEVSPSDFSVCSHTGYRITLPEALCCGYTERKRFEFI